MFEHYQFVKSIFIYKPYDSCVKSPYVNEPYERCVYICSCERVREQPVRELRTVY